MGHNGLMKTYHAHIYFDLCDLELAELLFRKASVQKDILKTWKIYDREVGPHPKPMFELHFDETTREAVIAWLKSNIGDWSALVHEDSGDDYRDHTENHEWIGFELPIKFSFFELVKADPSQILHKN